MHKLSLQNYATVLPHQRRCKTWRPRPPATPTRLQMRFWLLLQIQPEFAPSIREKEQQFTSRYLHETGTGGGGAGDPTHAVLLGATTQPQWLCFAEGLKQELGDVLLGSVLAGVCAVTLCLPGQLTWLCNGRISSNIHTALNHIRVCSYVGVTHAATEPPPNPSALIFLAMPKNLP